MAENENAAQGDEQQADAQQNRAQLRLNYENAKTSYTNFFIVNARAEEVVVNLGLSVMPPQQAPDQVAQVMVEITDRMIMTYSSAKRLAVTLGNIIQQYENVNGVIDLTPPQQQAQGQTPSPAPAADAESQDS